MSLNSLQWNRINIHENKHFPIAILIKEFITNMPVARQMLASICGKSALSKNWFIGATMSNHLHSVQFSSVFGYVSINCPKSWTNGMLASEVEMSYAAIFMPIGAWCVGSFVYKYSSGKVMHLSVHICLVLSFFVWIEFFLQWLHTKKIKMKSCVEAEIRLDSVKKIKRSQISYRSSLLKVKWRLVLPLPILLFIFFFQ